jgi:hypothetical protein
MHNKWAGMTSKIFKRLEVPCGWTAEQDIQVFVARFGEVDDYFGEAFARVDQGYEQLERSLDRALLLIAGGGISKAHIIHRLDTLRRHLTTNSTAESGMFLSQLDFVRFALAVYFRLAPCYLHHGDRHWLAPLVHLSDCLRSAATMLSEVAGAH